MKTPTLGAVWIMDCQGTRGEAGTRHYYKFPLKDDGAGSENGDSFVCAKFSLLAWAYLYGS